MAAQKGRGRSIFLPGMNPRPEKIITDKKDCREEVISESKATFVFVKNCENTEVDVQGKAGKVVCENSKSIVFQINDRLVGGTLELIRSNEVSIKIGDAAEIPIITVDSSTKVTVEISKKEQVKSIYFCDSKDIKIKLTKQMKEDSSTVDPCEYFVVDTTLEADDLYDDIIPQWVAHWNISSESATLITEKVVRDGIYPSTAQMKTAAEERENQALNRLVDMLIRPRPQHQHRQSPQQQGAKQDDKKESLDEKSGSENSKPEADVAADSQPKDEPSATGSESQPETILS